MYITKLLSGMALWALPDEYGTMLPDGMALMLEMDLNACAQFWGFGWDSTSTKVETNHHI